MNRSIVMILGFLLCACLIHPGQAQENEEAMTLARKLTEEGARTFKTADAKAMAAYYVEDARMYLPEQGKRRDSEKEYSGRGEIKKFYADIFKNPGTIQAKNAVDYVRRLGPDILVIAGTFVPNEAADKPLKVPFYQVRVKRGDRWLIHRLRIFVLPEKEWLAATPRKDVRIAPGEFMKTTEPRTVSSVRLVNGSTGDPVLYVNYPGRDDALLFDAGDLASLGADRLKDLAAVFLSHHHMDHFMGPGPDHPGEPRPG